MEGKLIIECFALILIISLAFAAVYSADADSVTLNDTTDEQGQISQSDDISHLNSSLSEIHYGGPVCNMALHI